MNAALLLGEIELSDTEKTILRTALKRSYETAIRHAEYAARLARFDVKRAMLNDAEDIQRVAVRLGLGLL